MADLKTGVEWIFFVQNILYDYNMNVLILWDFLLGN